MESKTLAQRISMRRKELGLSRDDLATALGVSVTAVQMWEAGTTKNLKLAHLCTIADALNVNVRWLAEGRGPKEAAANFAAYSTALSRRDEADSDEKRKGWERIAAVFAKAAMVMMLAIPPLVPERAEAAFNIIKSTPTFFDKAMNVIHIVRFSISRLSAVLVRLRTSFRPMPIFATPC